MKQGNKAVLAGGLAVAMLFACGRFAQAQENKNAGEPGAIMVETVKATATVTAIDAATRYVTLKMPDGKDKTLKCGPEVKNFDLIKVGDKVNFTFVKTFRSTMNREALDYREIDQFSIDYWESVDCNDVVADPDVVKDDSADESDLEELERQVNS